MTSPTTPSNVYWNSNFPSAKSCKLLDITRGKISVNPNGSSLLQSKSQLLNLIFIFGTARAGKSFMMNLLAGCHGVFSVINSSTPCTKGVDISNVFFPHSALVEHINSLNMREIDETLKRIEFAANPSPSQPVLGFVDVEGQGDQDNNHDVMLALPLLLTSKIILFNHKGAPTVSDMLGKMGVLARAADYIDVGEADGVDETKEQKVTMARKNSLIKGVPPSAVESHKFGHLHVLFRDFSFEGDEDAVYDRLMKAEAVPKLTTKKGAKSLLTSNQSDPDKQREEEMIRAIQERNDIRQLLEENFMSIHVWLFKQPASADDLKNNKEVPPELIDVEFLKTVQKLVYTIAQQCGTPTSFQGASLNGPRLVTLLSQIVTSLNTSGTISVPTVFRALEKENVSRVYEKVLSDFIETFVKSSFIPKFPLNTKEFHTTYDNQVKAAVASFDEALVLCVLDDEKKSRKDDLTAELGRQKSGLEKTNKERIMSKIDEVISGKMMAMKTEFDDWCNKNIPVPDGKQIESEFQQRKKAAETAITGVFTSLSLQEVFALPEYSLTSLKFEEVVTEFCHFKCIHNESVMKEKRINDLQEELIKQHEKLMDQNKRLESYMNEEKGNNERLKVELEKLKKEKQEEEQRMAENKRLIEQQKKELEELRKKQKKCEIL